MRDQCTEVWVFIIDENMPICKQTACVFQAQIHMLFFHASFSRSPYAHAIQCYGTSLKMLCMLVDQNAELHIMMPTPKLTWKLGGLPKHASAHDACLWIVTWCTIIIHPKQHHTSISLTLSCKVQISITHLKRVTIVPGVASAVTIKKSRFALPFLFASLTIRRSSIHHWYHGMDQPRLDAVYILQTQSANAQLQAVQLHVRCQTCDNSFWCIVHRVAQCLFRSVKGLRELPCLMQHCLM